MPIIIQTNTTLTHSVTYFDTVQVAPGVTLSIAPGVTVDLGGNELLNFGTVTLQGSETALATLTNGSYSTDSTTGILNSTFGKFDDVHVDGFFSNGTLNVDSSVFVNSTVDALASTHIEDSLLVDSILDLGIKRDVEVTRSTFMDSQVTLYSWPSFTNQSATITDSNFVTDGIAIRLDPLFSDGTHAIELDGNYMHVPAGKSFEDFVYDRDDDLRVDKNVAASDFVGTPNSNTPGGFSVGPMMLTWSDLKLLTAGQQIPGTAGNDNLLGSAVADRLIGLAGNDRLVGLQGNDTIEGGAGLDLAVYSGAKSLYQITKTPSGFGIANVSGSDGQDTLVDVERLSFSDGYWAYDLNGNAGFVAKILGAVFGPHFNAAYVSIGLGLADQGYTYDQLLDLALTVRLGQDASQSQVVTLLYANVVGSSPSLADVEAFVGLGLSDVQLGKIAAESSYNLTSIGWSSLLESGIAFM